ncbi:MAG: DUF5317 domain-containing protein [Solirubrobacteraceae bacterium]
MFLFVVFLVCLVSVPLCGGRLLALGELELRHSWLAVAGIGLQVLIVSVLPGGPAGFHEGVHMASYVLLGSFAWVNRRVPGVLVIGCGGLLNFVAIAANGGVMPADPALALHVAGGADGFVNAGAVEGARLPFLGDVLATPGWLPLYNVYSVGDVVIVLGVLVLLHRACGSRLLPRPVF